MYCPQCGTESVASLQYCRVCGANLKVIGKAVTLSEAIARSDRGPLPKLKEMMRNLTPEHVSEEISGALEKMNEEIARSTKVPKPKKTPWWREKKTPQERREQHRVKGAISFFSGIGLTIFLYKLFGALVLKLPPGAISEIPFELEPLIRVAWTVGFIPILSGVGHLTSSFFIRSEPEAPRLEAAPSPQLPPAFQSQTINRPSVASVTENTTNLLSNTVEQ
ncbi:MAG TPA: zinc ribbon domain-containing protein [Pyrinomonadaceae bacterium]|jgi:hypothetical protein|nr:zinc ribbon domain-containing protein [Pyrinomonadaceae bacterium]